MEEVKLVISKLQEKNKTIATMESCTGGGVCNAITNIEGASDVFSFSAITYSNEYKIKMGVSKDIIEKYTVYSKETAQAMAKAIEQFTNASYGVGITGKLNRVDQHNLVGDNNIVYISIYDKEKNIFYDQTVTVEGKSRCENKDVIIKIIMNILLMHI